MNKKNLFQLILIIFLILIVYIFYKNFFVTTPKIKKIQTNDRIITEKVTSNFIENLRYTSEDIFGNIYIIEAKSAEILNKEEEVLKLIDVQASIDSENQDTIFIKSSFADYNKLNNNTIFEKNVKIEYGDNLVTSNVIMLDFQKNLIEISENVHYMNLNTVVFADKVEIDLITKKLKLSMNNEGEEILLKGKY